MKIRIVIIFIVAAASLLMAGVSRAASHGDFVIVLDAGHGGHDAGAPGAITNEKSINLAVTRALGALLEKHEGIKVVYTRKNDTFVPLQGRADMANRAGGNLFVSIHTNSIDANAKNRSSVRGAAVYTLGLEKTDENLAVAMRENSVMKLERDYTTTYQGFDPNSAESYIIFEMSLNKHLQQSVSVARSIASRLATTAGRKNNGVKQANFWVLLKTSMPSVLVELDFICNPQEERFMASKTGQDKLARAIYEGIVDYLPLQRQPSGDRRDSRASARRTPSGKTSEASPVSVDAESKTEYRIQFLTAPRQLRAGSRDFKGLSPVKYYVERGVYKYTYGSYTSPREAAADLKRVRTLFPDAFVIKTVGDRRVP